MNYYPFHLGDYAAHTAHLEPLEDLAYRRMLDAYYLREAPLPADPAEVARLIRMRQNMADVEAVLREFFQLTDDGWTHARCDEEIDRMQDKQAKARASASASVNARRAKAQPALNDGTAAAGRTFSDRSTDVELPTPTPTPTPTPKKKREEERADPEATVTDHFRSPSGSRIPDGFPNADAIDWCKQHRQDLDPLATAERFRDHWVAKPGKDGRKLDWPATWRNWVRGERAPPVRAGPAKADRNAEIIAQLTGRQPTQREIVIDAEWRPVQATRIG